MNHRNETFFIWAAIFMIILLTAAFGAISQTPLQHAPRQRAASKSEERVLLRIDFDASHGIGSSRKQRTEESADVLAFLAETLTTN